MLKGPDMTKYNEDSKKAIDKYREKFVFLQVRVAQDERDVISQHAKDQGESTNQFIKRAIEETMKRDKRAKKKGPKE